MRGLVYDCKTAVSAIFYGSIWHTAVLCPVVEGHTQSIDDPVRDLYWVAVKPYDTATAPYCHLITSFWANLPKPPE